MSARKNITYILITALLIGCMQVTSLAASSNRINKVMTVMKDEILTENSAPKLIMTLADDLEEGDIFYLNLSGSKWMYGENKINLSGNINDTYLELKQMTATQLQVKIVGGTIKAGISLQIPMAVQVTADKVYVTVANNNTAVTSGTYLVAEAKSFLGTVEAGEIPVYTTGGIMAEIWIEEPFSQAFTKAMAKGENGTIQIQLNHNGYAFDLTTSHITLNGIKGFEGINSNEETVRQIDEQTIEITLPDMNEAKYTGGFILSGINIKATDKTPSMGRVTATVKGDLLTTGTVDVLEIADYAISLKTSSKTVRSGSKQSIVFTLEEKVEHSLIRTRPTYFSFDQGVYLETSEDDKVWVKINGQAVKCDTIIENSKVVGFEVQKLPEGEEFYQFEVEIVVPTSMEGRVTLTAEGRSLVEMLEGEVLKAVSPYEINVTPFEVKVGIKDQTGGRISLKEIEAASIAQGENIILKLEESAMKFTKAPSVVITEGDIRLEAPIVTADTIEIPVVRRSNTASKIIISDFTLTVDQTVANGTYTAQIGGTALSELADISNLDPLWNGGFIFVGGSSSIRPSVPDLSIQKVCFTIGKGTYSIGNVVKTMDAVPYISEGRTLIPIRYVADALGISADLVNWEGQTKTVTIEAKEKVVMQIGSKTMKVGNKVYTMSAAPVIKNGRTFVPVAEIARALNIETLWDATTKVVTFLNYL